MDLNVFRRYNIIKQCVKFAWQSVLYSREHNREYEGFREISRVIFFITVNRETIFKIF